MVLPVGLARKALSTSWLCPVNTARWSDMCRCSFFMGFVRTVSRCVVSFGSPLVGFSWLVFLSQPGVTSQKNTRFFSKEVWKKILLGKYGIGNLTQVLSVLGHPFEVYSHLHWLFENHLEELICFPPRDRILKFWRWLLSPYVFWDQPSHLCQFCFFEVRLLHWSWKKLGSRNPN